MVEAGKSVATIGGVQQGISPVLKGGDTGSTDVQVGFLGSVKRKYTGGGGHPRRVYKAYHWEAGTSSG